MRAELIKSGDVALRPDGTRYWTVVEVQPRASRDWVDVKIQYPDGEFGARCWNPETEVAVTRPRQGRVRVSLTVELDDYRGDYPDAELAATMFALEQALHDQNMDESNIKIEFTEL